MASPNTSAIIKRGSEQSLADALRELHYQKKALDEHAIVSVADADQAIIYANEKFCEISQFSPDELKGGHFFIGIGDEHSDEFFEEMIAKTRRGEIWHGQLCNHRKDESIYWTDTTIVPFCGEDGAPYKYVVIRTDITNQKNIEAEIRAKNVQIEAAKRELEEAQSELLHAEKLASIGRLAAGIAHEINTPTQFVGDNTRFLQDAFTDLMRLMRVYQQIVDTAQKGQVTDDMFANAVTVSEEVDAEYLAEEVPAAIEQALDGIKRVSEIVQSMKEFSHPGSEGKVHIDVNRAIASTANVCKNEWKYCAKVTTDFDETLPEIPCLAGEFNQTVLNILVNGAHAIESRYGEGCADVGSIAICTRLEGEVAEIRISDNGIGIPEDVLDKIFEPFFTTKDVGKGTGQGLAVARSVIVDKHDGTMAVESTLGEGTTFIIRLPLTEPAADESQLSET